MDTTPLAQMILPFALFLMMLGIGITLTGDDFRRVRRQPRAVLLGLLGQMLLLPLLGWLVTECLALPPLAAAGLMILTLAPGGVTSNLITLVARGDTALSVTLTAVTSLITPISLPLLTGLVLQKIGASTALPPFPILVSILKLGVVTLLPVLIGLFLRAHWPVLCRRLEPWVRLAAVLFFVVIVAALVLREWSTLPALLTRYAPAVLLLVVLAMASGYWLAVWGRLAGAARLTLSVEVGIQNAGTALMVTSGLLGSPEMSAVVLIYGVLMQLPAAGLMLRCARLPWRWRPFVS